MPELPEVETVRRSLLGYVPGRTIRGVEVRHPKVLRQPAVEDFCQRLQGARFERLERHGKLLQFHLTPDLRLLVHLGMTGQLTVRDPERQDRPFERHPFTGLQRTLQHPVDQHTHIVICLEEDCRLQYRDVRKFGRWHLFSQHDPGLAQILSRLGPDPLTPAWQFEAFAQAVLSSRRPIKALLLDQSLVAGVGNIYADEALFRAGIAPARSGCQLGLPALQRLWESVPKVLWQGIEQGGTSFSDYVDAEGQPGRNQELLQVYGRSGQPCPTCSRPLQRDQVAQRTTSWCPVCQSD